jgi:hypothetical protein
MTRDPAADPAPQPQHSRLDEGALAERLLPDGCGELCVYPLLFGAARLTFGRDPECPFGYDDCWDYPDAVAALAAMHAWDGQGEPEGWHRHPTSGRRRPEGDPAREYVLP